MAIATVGGAAFGAIGSLSLGAVISNTAYWSSFAYGAIGGGGGNAIGQLASGTSFNCLDKKQIATQVFVGGVAGAYGYAYASLNALSAYQVPYLSAATSGAISTTINDFIPSNYGGMGLLP